MKEFKTEQLHNVWSAYKNGVKKSLLAGMMKMSEDKLQEMLEAAQKRFGRGPLKVQSSDDGKEIIRDEPLFEPTPWKRAKAKYSNPSHDEMINAILDKQL